MACILHIETSTNVSSVAVSKDGFRVFEKEDHGEAKGGTCAEHSRSNASEKIGSMVDEAMQAVEDKKLKIEAVAVSSGPGSYTGLRIGVSMAKGLAYGSDAKLISIPTLQLLCVPILLGDRIKCYSNGEMDSTDSPTKEIREMEDDALLIPMIDARRMEVFAAVYDRGLKEVRATQADIVTEDTYKEFLDAHPVYFFGNGAMKCMDAIHHKNAHFIDKIEPLAKNMLPLADKRFHRGEFEDVAYFTPQYFKDYQAKLPKNLLKM